MCSGAKWKREAVPEHKFTNVDVNVFYESSFIRRIQYSFIFLILLKSFVMYTVDIWTAILLVLKGEPDTNDINKVNTSPFKYSRWVFVASIGMSFVLLLLEWIKARRIIRSQDIAYAFTNVAAYRTYCIKSYSHFCFFSQVNNSTTWKDSFAFWLFFRLKGYKRILLAEAPRQVINAWTIYSALGFTRTDKARPKTVTDIDAKYAFRIDKGDFMLSMTFNLMMFSFAVFAISLIVLLVAFALYVPFLCVIRGNLKEYVCHLVDKRIAGLLVKKSQKRIDEVKKVGRRLDRQEYENKAMGDMMSPESYASSLKRGASRRSTDSYASHATAVSAYSHRALLNEKTPNVPALPAMPAMPTDYPVHNAPAAYGDAPAALPVAMRAARQDAAPAVPRAYLATPGEPDGGAQSTFVKVRGFGGKVPYRAPSRRNAPPKSIVGEVEQPSDEAPALPDSRDGPARTERSLELMRSPGMEAKQYGTPQMMAQNVTSPPGASRTVPGPRYTPSPRVNTTQIQPPPVSTYSEYHSSDVSSPPIPAHPNPYTFQRPAIPSEYDLPKPSYNQPHNRNITSYADSDTSTEYTSYGRMGHNNFSSRYGGGGAGQRF